MICHVNFSVVFLVASAVVQGDFFMVFLHQPRFVLSCLLHWRSLIASCSLELTTNIGVRELVTHQLHQRSWSVRSPSCSGNIWRWADSIRHLIWKTLYDFEPKMRILARIGESSRGNATRGNRTESLWEEICLWEGLWEDLWKPLKNLWKPLKKLWKLPLRDPLRGRFPLRGAQSCCPYSVAP